MSIKEIFGLKIILCIVEKSPDLESEYLALSAWFLGRTIVYRDILIPRAWEYVSYEEKGKNLPSTDLKVGSWFWMISVGSM